MTNHLQAVRLASVISLALPSISVADALACDGLLDNHSITIYVPYEAGGGYDREARLIEPLLAKATGARVNVVNLVGLDGQLAMRAVLQSDATRETVLGYFNSTSILNAEMSVADGPSFSDFAPLGAFNSDYRALGGRAGIDFLQPNDAPILVAAFSSGAFMAMLGDLTGLEIVNIQGYSGSSDAFTAIARGDLDLVLTSALGMARNIQTFDMLEATLFFGPGESSPFDEAAYLVGDGGVGEAILARTAQADRADVQNILHLLENLTVAHRVLVGLDNLEGDIVTCLSDTTEAILTSTEMQEQALAVRSNLDPVTAPEMQSVFDTLSSMVLENMELLANYGLAPPR
jgi:hypothetical protein